MGQFTLPPKKKLEKRKIKKKTHLTCIKQVLEVILVLAGGRVSISVLVSVFGQLQVPIKGSELIFPVLRTGGSVSPQPSWDHNRSQANLGDLHTGIGSLKVFENRGYESQ